MEISAKQRAQRYLTARQNHSAWRLLASPRAPLVLACLAGLFEQAQDGVDEAEALLALADILASFASQDELEIDEKNIQQQAGRELREWIRRRLIIERGQRLYSTDALNSALIFADSLDNRIMTSTASRLLVVQQQIEKLAVSLNPNPQAHIHALEQKIQHLQQQLEQARQGHIEILTEQQAVESIREVYVLSNGLCSDFRRVEDSWREADKSLRQHMMLEDNHRGTIVDSLLDGQEALLNTPEGQVFDGFMRQLKQSDDITAMKVQINEILRHEATHKALNRQQTLELKWLQMRLIQESKLVMQARARSEKDVRNFIKTGLAAEHHRVSLLLNEVMKAALDVDWSKQKNKRAPTALPPISFALANIPMVERLLPKQVEDNQLNDLDFSSNEQPLNVQDDEFWAALSGLDPQQLLQDTLLTLKQQGRALSLSELAELMPPTEDLETFALWLAMAKDASITVNQERETCILTDSNQQRWQFTLPKTQLDAQALEAIEWDL